MDNKKVIVFSAPWCPHCDNLKALLESNHVDFKELNIDVRYNKELLKGSGHITIPVVQEKSNKGHMIASIADSSVETASLVRELIKTQP